MTSLMDFMTAQTILLRYYWLSCGANMISTTAATLLSESVPNVGEKPNQPKRFCFRKAFMVRRPLWSMRFSSTSAWFQNWAWIHYYYEVKYVAFCHPCMTAVRSKKLKSVSSKGDLAFIHCGYTIAMPTERMLLAIA